MWLTAQKGDRSGQPPRRFHQFIVLPSVISAQGSIRVAGAKLIVRLPACRNDVSAPSQVGAQVGVRAAKVLPSKCQCLGLLPLTTVPEHSLGKPPSQSPQRNLFLRLAHLAMTSIRTEMPTCFRLFLVPICEAILCTRVADRVADTNAVIIGYQYVRSRTPGLPVITVKYFGVNPHKSAHHDNMLSRKKAGGIFLKMSSICFHFISSRCG